MTFTYIVPYAEEAGNVSNTANITINNANVTNNANVGNTLTTSNLTASGNVSFTGANVSLGNVSNLHITGGTANYFLQTDGAGNLVWAAAAGGFGSNISNGTSNVSIATANGNITMSVNGTSNVVVVSSTSTNVTGNINASNANLGNLVTANFYSGNGSLLTGINGSNVSNVANANYANFAGTAFNVAGSNVSGQVANALVADTVYTNAQPNITSVGTLTNLTITGNLISGNANLGNLVTANYYTGTLTTNAQPNITSVGVLTSLSVSGNIISGNANLGNLVTANFYSGNGSLLTGLTAVNANFSNYAGNVINASQPNITSLGTLVNLSVSGNATFTGPNISLGNVTNVHMTGGNNGYFLQTDGAGNISWANGTTTGNGVVGGANRQIQYNNQGNFAGNVGLEYNYLTSNVNVPYYINSTQQNGNAYLTGWSNVQQMGVPSIFLGVSPNVPSAGSILNLPGTFTTVFANGTTPTSVFGSNTFPKPGVPSQTTTFPAYPLVPLVYNTGGNGNLMYQTQSNTIINFSNIGNGGIDAVISGDSGGRATETRYHIYSTDSTASQIYLSTANISYGNTNTTTIAFAGNYKVTSSWGWTGNTDYVILNTDNFSATSKWAQINYANSSVVISGNIGNSNSYARGDYIISKGPGTSTAKTIAYTANTGNSLGKYAIFNSGSNTWAEYNLPTVTPNATNSYGLCLLNAGNAAAPYYVMTLKDADVPNGISNSYTAITSNIDNSSSWTTYISSVTPTWFDYYYSNTSITPNVYVGINNRGNSLPSQYVTSTDGYTWSLQSSAGNIALAFLKITNFTPSANLAPPWNDVYTLTQSAIAPNSEFGIESPSNVNANLFAINANMTYSSNTYISIDGSEYLRIGNYKSLGRITGNVALWVKEA